MIYPNSEKVSWQKFKEYKIILKGMRDGMKIVKLSSVEKGVKCRVEDEEGTSLEQPFIFGCLMKENIPDGTGEERWVFRIKNMLAIPEDEEYIILDNASQVIYISILIQREVLSDLSEHESFDVEFMKNMIALHTRQNTVNTNLSNQLLRKFLNEGIVVRHGDAYRVIDRGLINERLNY